MRAFFTGIFLFASAVGLALVARFNPGNVVVFFSGWRIDLSLNLFLILLVSAFVLIYGLVRLLRNAFRLPAKVAAYRRAQIDRRAHRALRGALLAYFEGRYGQAEKQAEQARDLPETAGLAALIAARCAHRMTEYGRRDDWLRRADQSSGLRAARLMTEAECLVDARDATRALEVVGQLHAAGARHIQSLRLALKAHQYAGDWAEVLRLLRALNKRDAVHPAAARQIKTVAYRALLDACHGDSALIAFWQGMPVSDRRLPEIALHGSRAFNAAGLGYQARVILEESLAHQWDARLVEEYAYCGDDPQQQIERAERWLEEHRDDVHLHFALGVLCARIQLWGKAQSYLGRVLRDDREPRLQAQAHLELGRVHEKIGQQPEAATHFREAALLSLATRGLPGSPH